MRCDRIKFSYLAFAIFGAMALATAVPARAGVFTFSTAAGAKESGGNPVSATAVFTTSAGHVEVQLTNTLVDPKTVAQNLSDLFFTVGDGLTSPTSNYTSSGTPRTITGNGAGQYSDGAPVSSGWNLETSGSQIHLNDLGAGAAGPTHTIIGDPNGSNAYASANNSIVNNGPHNPFLAGTVQFDFDLTGVTADTSISDVLFSFGTVTGDNVPGVPEPIFYQLGALLGLGGLGVLRLRRKRA